MPILAVFAKKHSDVVYEKTLKPTKNLRSHDANFPEKQKHSKKTQQPTLVKTSPACDFLTAGQRVSSVGSVAVPVRWEGRRAESALISFSNSALRFRFAACGAGWADFCIYRGVLRNHKTKVM